MVYRHAVVTALRIYTQHSEDAAKGEVEGHVLKSHGNYIVDHGKSWKNHGIVFLNFCGNPEWINHLVLTPEIDCWLVSSLSGDMK